MLIELHFVLFHTPFITSFYHVRIIFHLYNTRDPVMTNSVTAHHTPSMVAYLVLLSYIPHTEVHDPKIHKSHFCNPQSEHVTDTNVTHTYLTLTSPNNFFFKKMHGGILQEVSWWALEKLRIKQYIKGGLSSGQFIICVFVSVLNKGDCVSGVWDTYICKHAHYKWKFRERRHCLIQQDMNFFLVLTATAITLDHPRKPLPKKQIMGQVLRQ